MYKLLAVDCDGTLLNDNKKIDSKTIEMLKQAKNRGLKIVLATSKSFFAIKKYLNEDNETLHIHIHRNTAKGIYNSKCIQSKYD